MDRSEWAYRNVDASVDWWMLAMVIFEEACRGDDSGGQAPTKKTVREEGIAGGHSLSAVPTVIEELLCAGKVALVSSFEVLLIVKLNFFSFHRP